MSTKATMYYNVEERRWHLYEEMMDEKNVYLSFPAGALDEATLAIPLHIWHEMRQKEHPIEKFLDMTLDDLTAYAEQRVTEHREWLKEHNSPLGNLYGVGAFGDSNSSHEEMVDYYIERHLPYIKHD